MPYFDTIMERFWSREGTGAVAGTAAGACAKLAAREARKRISSRMGILQSISVLTMMMQAPVEVDLLVVSPQGREADERSQLRVRFTTASRQREDHDRC